MNWRPSPPNTRPWLISPARALLVVTARWSCVVRVSASRRRDGHAGAPVTRPDWGTGLARAGDLRQIGPRVGMAVALCGARRRAETGPFKAQPGTLAGSLGHTQPCGLPVQWLLAWREG